MKTQTILPLKREMSYLESRPFRGLLKTVFIVIVALLMSLQTLQADVIEVIINTDADAFIHQGLPDTNFGSGSHMRIGSKNDPSSPPMGTKRALIHFDLTSLPSDVIITKATFEAYQTDNLYIVPNGFNIHAVTSSWTEGNVTWNNQPTFGDFLGNMDSKIDAIVSFQNNNLTQIVSDWHTNTTTNYGLRFKLPDETLGTGHSGTWGDTFASRENVATNYIPPRLDIEYIPEPATLSLLALGGIALLRRRRR